MVVGETSTEVTRICHFINSELKEESPGFCGARPRAPGQLPGGDGSGASLSSMCFSRIPEAGRVDVKEEKKAWGTSMQSIKH